LAPTIHRRYNDPTVKPDTDGLPILALSSRPAWEAWLSEQHATAAGAWLKLAKKGAPTPTLRYKEALLGAIAHGWIDGQKGGLDDAYWLQRFTPRKPGSRWSKQNCDRALALIERGEMRPAGQREVNAARADGRWDRAYHGQRTMGVPDDLRAALAANPRAEAFFSTLDSVNRYAVLYRIQDLKTPEARARRIERNVGMLVAGETLHPSSKRRNQG
jgi:uncharacterized protein YdeI (YjbR/CyaY-like superfamily)